MGQINLSIIIPTKNRQKYCLCAIKQILNLNLSNYEICIQDNSDSDILKEQISALHQDNIIYNYHKGILSFVDNFSEAVTLSNGLYCIMIGDDDGILPSISKYTEYAIKHGIDAIIPSLSVVYFWPTYNPVVPNSSRGLLQITNTANNIKKVSPKKALKKLLKNAVQHYTSFDLPRLYHGLVKKSCLEKIKDKTGNYFSGLTPDIYMATALCYTCSNTIRVNEALTISGICPTSGSSDSATGKHTGKLSDAPHFRGHNSYEWDKQIPAFYSVDTIWAETLLHTLHDFGDEKYIDYFNLPLFEHICLKRFPQFSDIILEHCNKNNLGKINLLNANLSYFIVNFHRVIINRIINRPIVKNYTDISDIENACMIYCSFQNDSK